MGRKSSEPSFVRNETGIDDYVALRGNKKSITWPQDCVSISSWVSTVAASFLKLPQSIFDGAIQLSRLGKRQLCGWSIKVSGYACRGLTKAQIAGEISQRGPNTLRNGFIWAVLVTGLLYLFINLAYVSRAVQVCLEG